VDRNFTSTFDIWAKRGVYVVRQDDHIRDYDRWVFRQVIGILASARDNCPGSYPNEYLINELKHQLLARLEYWKGAARRFAREILESCAAAKRKRQDTQETVNPLGMFGGSPTISPATDREIQCLRELPHTICLPGENPAEEDERMVVEDSYWPSLSKSVMRRQQKNGDIEGVRNLARQMLAEGATHQAVCQRLKDAARPPAPNGVTFPGTRPTWISDTGVLYANGSRKTAECDLPFYVLEIFLWLHDMNNKAFRRFTSFTLLDVYSCYL
jgi:hypothetical protein